MTLTDFFSSFVASIWIESLVKGAVLLIVAWGATLLLRRASAAHRHLAWTAAFVGLLLLPVSVLVGPTWVFPSPHGTAEQDDTRRAPFSASETEPSNSVSSSSAEVRSEPSSSGSPPARRPNESSATSEHGDEGIWGISWRLIFGIVSAGGTLVLGLRLLVGMTWMRTLRKEAEPASSEEIGDLKRVLTDEFGMSRSVTIAFHRSADVPMTWGILRPTILLPEAARTWDAPCLRAAIAHELAHIKRGDYLSHMLAQWARALHWMNPFAWLAERWMVSERERASDDLVVTRAMKPSEYAEHLLNLAGRVAPRTRLKPVAPSMADRPQVAERIRAICARGLDRIGASRRAWTAAGIATLGVTILLGAAVPEGSPVMHTRGTPWAWWAESDSSQHRIELGPPSTTDARNWHLEPFQARPEEEAFFGRSDTTSHALPPVDTSRAKFFNLFYSRDKVEGDASITVMVVPEEQGERLWIDLDNDEDLTDESPVFFGHDEPEHIVTLKNPANPRQVTERVIMRLPRWVRTSDSTRKEFLDEQYTDDGILKSAQLYRKRYPGFSGRSGTFYFSTRLALRRGTLKTDGREVALGVFDYNANGLYNDREDLLLVDLNDDDLLRYNDENEVFKLSDIFAIDSTRFEVTSVDPYGRSIEVAETSDTTTHRFIEELEQKQAEAAERGRLRSSVWSLELETLDGQTIDLASFRDQHVLLNFWGEWCGPCIDEIPALVEAYETHSSDRLQIIGILNPADMDEARTMIDEKDMDWPQVRITDDLKDRFDIRGYPTNLLLLPGGNRYVEAHGLSDRFFNLHMSPRE